MRSKFSTPPVNQNDGEALALTAILVRRRGERFGRTPGSPVLGRNRKLKKVNLMWSFCGFYGTIHLALLKITNNVNKLTGDFGINDKKYHLCARVGQNMRFCVGALGAMDFLKRSMLIRRYFL